MFPFPVFSLCSNLQLQVLGRLHMAQMCLFIGATEIYKCYDHWIKLSMSVRVCMYVMCLKVGDGALTHKNKLLEFSKHSVSAFIVHSVACHSSSVTFWSEQLLVFIYFWVSGVGPERCSSANVLLPMKHWRWRRSIHPGMWCMMVFLFCNDDKCPDRCGTCVKLHIEFCYPDDWQLF